MSRKSKSDSNPDGQGTTVTCSLDSESNKYLTDSASDSIRSKKGEAELRLADHLRRYKSISSLGVVENR